MIIYFGEPNEVADELFEWYAEKWVTGFGEDVDVYNENKEYISEEPAGRYELLQLAASFAESLHREGARKKHLRMQVFFQLYSPVARGIAAQWHYAAHSDIAYGSSDICLSTQDNVIFLYI